MAGNSTSARTAGGHWEEKLRGKGRSKRKREVVFLPPPITPEPEEPKTPPAAEDYWPSSKGQLTLVADFGRHLIEQVCGAMAIRSRREFRPRR